MRTDIKVHSQRWLPNKFRANKSKFSKDESGVAAVEFAMLAAPFFLTLFSIIEISMVFFGNTNIEYATREAARLIRTGQAQNGTDFTRGINPVTGAPNTGSITKPELIALICSNMFMTQNCTSKLKVQVKTFSSWDNLGAANLAPPIVNGAFNTGNMNDFVQPAGCAVTIVRAFIVRDLIAQIPGVGISNITNGPEAGNLVQVGSAIFQTEPYQNAC